VLSREQSARSLCWCHSQNFLIFSRVSNGDSLIPADPTENSTPSTRKGKRSSFEILFCLDIEGARGSVVVKALCYNPEGRGFDNR
jgi:hypothetical protein